MPNCPICETVDCKESNSGKPDAVRFDCKRCGEFDLTGTVLAVLPNALAGGVHRRALMSHVIRQMKGLDASPRPLIVSDKLESYWPTDRLPPPSAQADRLILLSGDKQLSPEDPIRFAAYFLDAWVGASLTTPGNPHAGVEWLLRHLMDEKLLNWQVDSADDGWK